MKKIAKLIIMNPSKSGNSYGLGTSKRKWRQIRKEIELAIDVEKLEEKHISSFTIAIGGSPFDLHCLGNLLNPKTGGRITHKNIASWLSNNHWCSSKNKFVFDVEYDIKQRTLHYEYMGRLV